MYESAVSPAGKDMSDTADALVLAASQLPLEPSVPAVQPLDVLDANPYADKLITSPGMPEAVVEQYRSLASILYRAQRDNGVRTLMITSAAPTEGKTLAASNLALTLSHSYSMRVLLVDADFRNPAIHKVFGLDNTRGLTTAVAAADLAFLTETSLGEGLTVVTAGPPANDAVRLVSAATMRDYIKLAVAHFDWVIIDTPPAGLFPDAGVLAPLVDRVILVIKAGKTPYTMVQRAADVVGREKVIGTVLNCTELRQLVPGAYAKAYKAYGAIEPTQPS